MPDWAALLHAFATGGAQFGQSKRIQEERQAQAQRQSSEDALTKRRKLLEIAALERAQNPQARTFTVEGRTFPDTPEGHTQAEQWKRTLASAGRAPAAPEPSLEEQVERERALAEARAAGSRAGAPPVARTASPTPARGTPEYLQMIEDEARVRASVRPASAVDQRVVRENQQLIGDIEDIERALKEYPAGIGKKGFLPDFVLQRTDPEGVQLRAALANLASAVTLMRSGGAVSDAEFSRLEPFLPKDTDTPEAIKVKLKNLKAFFHRKTGEAGATAGGTEPEPFDHEQLNEPLPDDPEEAARFLRERAAARAGGR